MSNSGTSDQDWQEARRRDSRGTHELIAQALTAPDEEAAWEAITVLHWRATREVLDAARALAASACPLERGSGADILGQLGVPERVFADVAIDCLVAMLDREQDEEVLQSIAIALGHQGTRRGIGPLLRLTNHPSAHVRQAVIHGLAHEDDRAIAALIGLSTDSAVLVRDWATFTLGSQLDADTPALRAALAARLEDPDGVTRGEALVGLARRGDRQVVEPLLRELASGQNDDARDYAVEAAALIDDPRLAKALQALEARS